METDQVVGKRNIPKGKGAGCVAPVREEGRAGGRGPEMWAEGRGGGWQKVGSGEEGKETLQIAPRLHTAVQRRRETLARRIRRST